VLPCNRKTWFFRNSGWILRTLNEQLSKVANTNTCFN
jgi:hypothetical protein